MAKRKRKKDMSIFTYIVQILNVYMSVYIYMQARNIYNVYIK